MLVSIPDLVIFCPLPPKPNGIADYLAEQLPYFAQTLSVCVVIENSAPSPINIDGRILVLRLAEYLALQEQLSEVAHLYHVGNNPDTVYMLPILLNVPGIVVIHDLNLHYLIDLTNLSKGEKSAYTNALFNQYGSAGKVLGSQLEKHQWKGRLMPSELLMNGSIIEAASHIIVHSLYSKNFIAAQSNKPITVIPHHLSPDTRHYQSKMKMTYRGQLGLPGDKLVITSMGFIAKAKQIRAVLQALSQLKDEGNEFIYVLAGQCKPHEYDVYQDIAEFGLQENVIVTGFLSTDSFFKYLVASDFIVNLRYPSGGESSGTLTRAMGLGLACIVVNIGPFAEIPDNCAVKLDYDEDFIKNLTFAVSELANDVPKRVKLGLNARRWTEETQEISVTTSAYLSVVSFESNREFTSIAANLLNQGADSSVVWHEYLRPSDIAGLGIEKITSLAEESDGTVHWWKECMLPINQYNDFYLVSETSETFSIAEELFGYIKANTSIHSPLQLEGHEESFDSMKFDRFLINLPVRWIENDPVAMLAKVNHAIKIGAVGCISLFWDSEVLNEVDLSRNAILTYLEAAGFSINSYVTGSKRMDFEEISTVYQHDQEWCFSVTKRSSMINLNPQPYYSGSCSSLKLLKEGDAS